MSTIAARRAAPPAESTQPGPRALAAATLAAALVAGCAAPSDGAAGGTPSVLYVANAGDGTVARLDGRTGRATGPPLPAGVLPDRVVPGPGGSLLIRSFSPGRSTALTHVAPSGADGSTSPTGTTGTAHVVPLEAGAREVWLAGNGGRQAVVAYHAPDPKTGRLRCRLALVDTVSGVVHEPHTICAAPNSITGLAFGGGSGGPVAFVGMWQPADQTGVAAPASAAVDAGAGRDWLVAVHGVTGSVVAAAPLASPPSCLMLTPAPGRIGFRLYYIESLSRPDEASPGTYRGRLLGLDPTTLELESHHAVDSFPTALALAPDGGHAYVLTAEGYALTQINLATGAQRLLASLPHSGFSLAVTDERVYVPNVWASELWVVDRRQGRVAQIVPVGQMPLSVTLGRAA